MKLCILSNQRLPTEKAYGLQIAAMCSAFAQGNDTTVELVYPTRTNRISSDVFAYYELPRAFAVHRVSAPDFQGDGIFERFVFGIKNILSAVALLRYALKREVDVYYSRDEIVLYFLSFFRSSLAYEAHNFQQPRRVLYRRFIEHRVKVIALTSRLRDDFVAFGFPSEDILVAPDGVNSIIIEREENNPAAPSMARDVLGILPSKSIVVYAGSLYSWKGVYCLAAAARLLPDIEFIFVGGDQRGEEAQLRAYIQEQKISNCTITGYIQSQERIRMYLAAADVLVLPNTARTRMSERYTSPLKLFDYMAAHRPIVASDLPSLRDILTHENAILVGPDDASALRDGIRKILDDKAFGVQLAERAFEDVHRYTWQKRAANILHFIGNTSPDVE